MVTISSFEQRKNKKNEEFNVLILQGNAEVVISKETGKPYLTARKTSIPCTFDENMAKTMLGKELPGEILKMDCDRPPRRFRPRGRWPETGHNTDGRHRIANRR